MISLYINNLQSQNKVVSTLGNRVTISLNQPIILDEKKKYNLRLIQANIVYCTPNILSNVNDIILYTYNSIPHVITLSQGLYGVEDINKQIAISLLNDNMPSSIIQFIADPATSKIYIAVAPQVSVIRNTTSSYVIGGTTYTNNHSILPLLGFTCSDTSPNITNSTSSTIYALSESQANLNSVQNIYIKCDMVTGSYQNAQIGNIIAGVVPDVAPYSTIIFKPYYPTRLPLIPRDKIDSFTFTLVDDQGRDIDFGTSGGQQTAELWSILITIQPEDLPLSHS